MPNFNRRGFLQILGVVGLTPFLPGMSAKATVTNSGVSVSKALWTSLYANSGSVSEFVGVARNMGLSNKAIQGVGARSIGVRLALATSAQTVASGAPKIVRPALSHGERKLNVRKNIKRALEQLFPDEVYEAPMLMDEKAESRGGENKDAVPGS